MRSLGIILFAVVATFVNVSQAHAQVTVLTFEGLQSNESVNNFYNGGTGSLGSSGTNYGISFTSNSLALTSGSYANNPSGPTILFFLSGAAATMNVAAGFDTGFSFFYCAANNPGLIRVYSGLNATGTQLATLTLPVTPTLPPGSPAFNNWQELGVTFPGTAMSVDFGGTANQIGFDNVTLGSSIPVPEPVSLMAVAALGMAGVGCFRRFRTAVSV